jgi:hypothetical protein
VPGDVDGRGRRGGSAADRLDVTSCTGPSRAHRADAPPPPAGTGVSPGTAAPGSTAACQPVNAAAPASRSTAPRSTARPTATTGTSAPFHRPVGQVGAGEQGRRPAQADGLPRHDQRQQPGADQPGRKVHVLHEEQPQPQRDQVAGATRGRVEPPAAQRSGRDDRRPQVEQRVAGAPAGAVQAVDPVVEDVDRDGDQEARHSQRDSATGWRSPPAGRTVQLRWVVARARGIRVPGVSGSDPDAIRWV